jgi:putative cardiolipin synthase
MNQATRRMHNKSFNADNQVAVVGGRNIADEYFEIADDVNMADLDVVTVGPVVQNVGESFDSFWNCPASIPITNVTNRAITPKDFDAAMAQLRSDSERVRTSPAGMSFTASPLVEQLRSGAINFYWGNATLICDDPRKASAQSDAPEHRMLPKIKSVVDGMQHEIVLVSPYFVPGKAGVKFFRTLRERGIRVVILTGSMAASDVLPVYAAYSRYRKELLEMGVELYEFKPNAMHARKSDESDHEHLDDADDRRSLNNSTTALHAKVFGFDRATIFVGSLNLDPRSARLNTEVGVLFDSPEMANLLWDRLENRLLEIAWKVEAVPDPNSPWREKRLTWVTNENGSPLRLTKEPGQSFLRNLAVGLLRMLPIESQL